MAYENQDSVVSAVQRADLVTGRGIFMEDALDDFGSSPAGRCSRPFPPHSDASFVNRFLICAAEALLEMKKQEEGREATSKIMSRRLSRA